MSKVRVVGVINKGGRGNELICHRTCSYCNCLLEFRSGDVEVFNDDYIHLEYVICPNCNKLVVVVSHKYLKGDEK